MKILIVSNSPWRSDNSFGNSFSNIFEGIENIEIANIYCKYGMPQNGFVSKYFQITEKSLINNLLKGKPSGKEIFQIPEEKLAADDGESTFNKMKRHKIIPMFWIQAMIWKIGRWKSPELIQFVDDFKPDLLFIPIYYSHYLHDINRFILKRFHIPAIGYVSDDVYTLKQFSLSPLYWLDRFMLRPKIKKIFSQCKTIYVISETQRKEYSNIFGDKFKVLTKCADFSDKNKPEFKEPDGEIKLLYAGNISKGRYKILSQLAKAISEINLDGNKMKLDVYTQTPLKERQTMSLNIDGCCALHPPVSYEEIKKIQNSTDILVHVEAFDLKERLSVHQSFSTKIVDYLASNRCILAIGASDCASIKYFIDNECAAVAETPTEIKQRLTELISDKALFSKYAEKAWQSGKNHHKRTKMQSDLYNEIKLTIGEK